MSASAEDRWKLIYDGDCAFCRRQVRLIGRWDRAGRIQPVAFQQADLQSLGITRASAEEAMHLVSPRGAVSRGAMAAAEVLRLLPLGWTLSWVFRLPGVMSIAERAYGWVARRRHRFGCESPACRRGDGRGATRPSRR